MELFSNQKEKGVLAVSNLAGEERESAGAAVDQWGINLQTSDFCEVLLQLSFSGRCRKKIYYGPEMGFS